MSVYDSEAFNARVNLAALYIVKGFKTTRHFDTCFEMSDGDAVVVALYRRSLKNPRLAESMWRYISKETAMPKVEQYKAVKNLTALARTLREQK